MKIYEAAERTPQLSENLLNVLENSVRAMHHFLSDTEECRLPENIKNKRQRMRIPKVAKITV